MCVAYMQIICILYKRLEHLWILESVGGWKQFHTILRDNIVSAIYPGVTHFIHLGGIFCQTPNSE